MIGDLKRRVAKLESNGGGDVILDLANGAARVLHSSWVHRAMYEAITGVDSWQAWAMLNAVASSDGSPGARCRAKPKRRTMNLQEWQIFKNAALRVIDGLRRRLPKTETLAEIMLRAAAEWPGRHSGRVHGHLRL